MISVEIRLDGKQQYKEIVEIYMDRKGLEELQARLNRLDIGKNDHLHLMSESWGLGDLEETLQGQDNLLVHHLRLTLVDK